MEEMYYEAKRFDKVIEINRKIIGVLEEMNDAASIAICHANLGSTLLQEGLNGKAELLDEAETNFKQALEFVEKQQDQRRQAYLLGNLGILYLHKKDFDQSFDYYNRSLKIMTDMGDELGEARSYANLGKIETLKKNWDAAAEQYGKSLQIMEKHQNRPGMAQQNEALGEIFLQQENFEEAEKFLQNANSMYEALKDPQGIRIVQDKLLYLLSHPKTIQKRKAEIESKLKTPEVENDNAQKISLLTDLSNMFFLGNQLDDASNALGEVLKIQEATGDKSGMSSTYGNMGSILSEKEDWEASDQYYEKAIALREGLSSDSTALLELYGNRAIVLIHLNKLDKAEKLMRRTETERVCSTIIETWAISLCRNETGPEPSSFTRKLSTSTPRSTTSGKWQKIFGTCLTCTSITKTGTKRRNMARGHWPSPRNCKTFGTPARTFVVWQRFITRRRTVPRWNRITRWHWSGHRSWAIRGKLPSISEIMAPYILKKDTPKRPRSITRRR
jgi:tetratricopeptide (TPR) repeat protein